MLHLKRNYSKNKPQRAALKLAVIYALIAGAYILLSDRLVESLTENAHTLTKLQTIKGWLFIIGTAVILFLLLNRELKVKWQLWESENRFTSLFYHSIDAHLLISQNGQIFAANDRACRMFEFTPEEIQEVNIDKLLNWFDSGLGYVFEQLQKKGNFTGELIGIKKSGRTFPCGASFSPFEDSENNLYINITLQDISHRKEAEKALRESETRLELAIEGSDGGFWDLKFEPEDSSEGIPDKIYLSPRLKSFIGFKDDEFPNSIESWQSRILPQDLQRLQETARAHLQGEISLHKTKYRIRHKDGSIRWLQTHGKIMRDEGGKPVRWSGLDWDITDIVELQQQLKASEELYRLTLSNISDAVFITDDQGKFTFICPNVDVIFGYSVEETEKLGNIANLLGEDLPVPPQNGSSTEIENIERVVTDATNQEHVVLISIKQVSIGEGTRLYTCRDITERKDAEEKLRESQRTLSTLMSNLPGIAYRCQNDIHWTMEFISDGCKELTGYKPSELIHNSKKSFAGLIHSEDRDKVWHEVQEALEANNAFEITYRIVTASGQIKWVWEKGRAVSTSKPGHLVIEGLINDITHRKKAEEALTNSNNEIRALASHLQSVREEERINISREIHDELGQILTVLKMDLSLIEQEVTKDNGKINSSAIVEEIETMNKLIDQSTQKVTKLITELRPEILDNLGLLPALEWQVEDLREHRGISCRFHSTVKELALKDELSTAIFRIFQEALTNVARHSKATEVDISLEKINDYLRLRIIDNGIGLSEDQLKDSERFGLIGMKERAKVFGGSVEIEGKKEKGTRVEVRIPIS